LGGGVVSGDDTAAAVVETQRRIDQYEDLVDDGNLPDGHTFTFSEDGSEFSEYCECGKWLEPRYYLIWDHIDAVLKGEPG
jgi:hypothetical protein